MSFSRIVLASLAFTALSLSAAERMHTKKLAGPASDFQSGFMAPIDPSEAAIHSKSAMLPIHLQAKQRGGSSWIGTLPVDNGEQFSMVLFSGGESWRISMRAPGSRKFVPATELLSEYKQTTYGIEENEVPGEFYTFEGLAEGSWTLKVEADASLRGEGYLLVGSTGPYRLRSYKTTTDTLVGNSIGFVAEGYDAAAESAQPELIKRAHMLVTDPYGQQRRFALFDDGAHNDGAAGDGIFGGDFQPTEVGSYQVQVVANGRTPEGLPFVRTAEHLLEVKAPEVILHDMPAKSAVVDQKRMLIGLEVDTFDGGLDKFRTFAEVWGKDANGNDLAVGWIGGMVYVEDGLLPLTLDARWIALAGAVGPFELRNVRIEDPDHFVPMARAKSLPVLVEELPKAAYDHVKAIDDEMLMGPRPEMSGANKAGHTLMLVHGYCSGDVWGGNMGNFTNATKFQDYNQNRSHDAFAQRIKTAGSGFDGFGIVAHSQGGCAALHLYTYYYSGLDYTTSGSRLIQSVGTPYQGTSLAGNLALLGQIFGAGCGTNYDLTYDGASAWLSGIPTWARDDVYFSTTSFKDVWYAYDYCHIATDPFLSDPDDGTTEKSKGQLSGGVNMGHKTGWCHTGSMRDPAQCTDSSRNTNMSSNAKR